MQQLLVRRAALSSTHTVSKLQASCCAVANTAYALLLLGDEHHAQQVVDSVHAATGLGRICCCVADGDCAASTRIQHGNYAVGRANCYIVTDTVDMHDDCGMQAAWPAALDTGTV